MFLVGSGHLVQLDTRRRNLGTKIVFEAGHLIQLQLLTHKAGVLLHKATSTAPRATNTATARATDSTCMGKGLLIPTAGGYYYGYYGDSYSYYGYYCYCSYGYYTGMGLWLLNWDGNWDHSYCYSY